MSTAASRRRSLPPPLTAVSERERLWLFSCLLLALLPRLAVVLVLDVAPESDFATYRAIAQSIVAGRGITDGANFAFMSAGYPMLLLAPVFWLSDNSLLAAQVANALLGVGSTALCWAVAREAGATPRGRLLAAGLFALYLPSWIYAEYLAKENLMTPLMLALIWASLRLWRAASAAAAWVAAAVAGLACGLLALVGNAGLALVPALAAGLALGQGSVGVKIARLVLVSITAVTVALPWALRNQEVLGSAVMNTNGGFNLYLGNNPAATGRFVSIADTPGAQRWHTAKREGEIAAEAAMREEALAWIRSHPGEFVQLALRKGVLFWTPPVHEGQSPPSRREALARDVWLWQFLLLCGLGLGSLALYRWPGPSGPPRQGLLLLWIALAGYTAVHMLFYVIFRYREPIMPVLAVLAALALDALIARGRAGPGAAVASASEG
jgi:4-amino-4-deoxy-L-arabinose transferase-like glycosyltransferase